MPQSLSKVYIHFVFSTKNREAILADEWRDELFNVIGGLWASSEAARRTDEWPFQGQNLAWMAVPGLRPGL